MLKKNTSVKQISSSTPIIFTIKGFFSLIGAMIALFYGFYASIILPKINKTEEHYDLMYRDQKTENKLFYNELSKINVNLTTLNVKMDEIYSKKNLVTLPESNSKIDNDTIIDSITPFGLSLNDNLALK